MSAQPEADTPEYSPDSAPRSVPAFDPGVFSPLSVIPEIPVDMDHENIPGGDQVPITPVDPLRQVPATPHPRDSNTDENPAPTSIPRLAYQAIQQVEAKIQRERSYHSVAQLEPEATAYHAYANYLSNQYRRHIRPRNKEKDPIFTVLTESCDPRTLPKKEWVDHVFELSLIHISEPTRQY